MNRSRSRALLLLTSTLGATLLLSGQAHAQGFGLFGSIPFDDDCDNNGQARLAPVANANLDFGDEVVTSCEDELIP